MDIRVNGFKTDYRPDGTPVEWVHYTGKDAMSENGQLSHSTWEKISRVIPKDVMRNDDDGLKSAVMRSTWAQIEPAYLAWKEGNEIPTTGTPLGAWAGVNTDQAAALRGVGLLTVEAVADVSEVILGRPPLPNMRELKRQAGLWLEGLGQSALQAKLTEMEERNAAMMEMLAELQADKPKRGRPRKEEAEQDEAA